MHNRMPFFKYGGHFHKALYTKRVPFVFLGHTVSGAVFASFQNIIFKYPFTLIANEIKLISGTKEIIKDAIGPK